MTPILTTSSVDKNNIPYSGKKKTICSANMSLNEKSCHVRNGNLRTDENDSSVNETFQHDVEYPISSNVEEARTTKNQKTGMVLMNLQIEKWL